MGQLLKSSCLFIVLHLILVLPVGSTSGDGSVCWSDVRVAPEESGARGAIFKVWSDVAGDETQPRFVASLELSGLRCLGVHLPPSALASKDALILHMYGSYFTTDVRRPGDMEAVSSRHLFFGPFSAHQSLSSYNATLLTRILRLHRANRQQAATNANFKESLAQRGLCRPEEYDSLPEAPPARTLRQRVLLDRPKEARTRAQESRLGGRIEEVRLRLELGKREKTLLEDDVRKRRQRAEAIRHEVEEKTSALMNRLHTFSKDRAAFVEWRDRRRTDYGLVLECLWRASRASQLRLLSCLKTLFPIQDPQRANPTIRWVSLPPLERARTNSREEVALSVTLGWVAHVLSVVSKVTDVPLRYPIHFRGSMSLIRDPARSGGVDEFPLYAKSAADWAKLDYGLFLLNKDLAQVRWQWGLITSDLTCTLKNLYELLSLGSSAKDKLSDQTLTLPPNLSLLIPPPMSAAPPLIPRKNSELMIMMQQQQKEHQRQQQQQQEQEQRVTTSEVEKADSSKPEADSTNSSGDEEKAKSDLETKGEDVGSSQQDEQWVEIADRAKALSIPSSFQRKSLKTNNPKSSLAVPAHSDSSRW